MPLRLLLCVLCVSAVNLFAADNAKPNILFFFADDWGRDAPCYADPPPPPPPPPPKTPPQHPPPPPARRD